jgi:asparagine synthase (glutamine-hydrolysing)
VSAIWTAAADEPQPLSADALLSAVRTAVAGSVRAHQVADVPVGAFLSAGIDSGTLVGLLAQERSAPLQTLTLGFSRFHGSAGDELFGGYDHFARLPIWQRRLQRLAAVPGVLPLLSSGLRLGSRLGLVHTKAAALTRLGPSLAGLYLVRRGLFMPWELPGLLDGDLLREGLAALQPPAYLEAGRSAAGTNAYAQIAALDATNYLRNQLLRDSDWASMDHSLELRTPLVDLQLLRELAPALVAPRSFGMEGKRALALAPVHPLPEAVINRPKSGFTLPMGQWLEQSSLLDHWRQIPRLSHPSCHWARRMAYGLAMQWMS